LAGCGQKHETPERETPFIESNFHIFFDAKDIISPRWEKGVAIGCMRLFVNITWKNNKNRKNFARNGLTGIKRRRIFYQILKIIFN
jgi:hypothetical protein